MELGSTGENVAMGTSDARNTVAAVLRKAKRSATENIEALPLMITRFFEALSLSGGIIFTLAMLTCSGIWLSAHDKPVGEKIWTMFGSSLTTFVTGKKIGESEILKKMIAKDDKKDGE
jgi:hypothetical protein